MTLTQIYEQIRVHIKSCEEIQNIEFINGLFRFSISPDFLNKSKDNFVNNDYLLKPKDATENPVLSFVRQIVNPITIDKIDLLKLEDFDENTYLFLDASNEREAWEKKLITKELNSIVSFGQIFFSDNIKKLNNEYEIALFHLHLLFEVLTNSSNLEFPYFIFIQEEKYKKIAIYAQEIEQILGNNKNPSNYIGKNEEKLIFLQNQNDVLKSLFQINKQRDLLLPIVKLYLSIFDFIIRHPNENFTPKTKYKSAQLITSFNW